MVSSYACRSCSATASSHFFEFLYSSTTEPECIPQKGFLVIRLFEPSGLLVLIRWLVHRSRALLEILLVYSQSPSFFALPDSSSYTSDAEETNPSFPGSILLLVSSYFVFVNIFSRRGFLFPLFVLVFVILFKWRSSGVLVIRP